MLGFYFTFLDSDEERNIKRVLDIVCQMKNIKQQTYYHGEKVEYCFEITDGCRIEEINKIELDRKHSLPNDYKEFLLITNGLRFSTDVSAALFDVKGIYELHNIFSEYPKNILAIGSCWEGAIHIIIDLQAEANQNMGIREAGNHYIKFMNCGFTVFLDRFLTTYGSDFWEWGISEKKMHMKS